MSTELHCYQYVNRPFEAVREALVLDGVELFERNLKVSIAGVDVGKDVVVKVKRVEPHIAAPGHVANDAIRFEIEWRARTSPALFPSMKAKLVAYALGPSETQLDLVGNYEPPGGVVGDAADWLVGHRIAEASVKCFLDGVAGNLSLALT